MTGATRLFLAYRVASSIAGSGDVYVRVFVVNVRSQCLCLFNKRGVHQAFPARESEA